MIHFTDQAREMILKFLGEEPDAGYYAVRVAVESESALEVRCSVALVESEYVRDHDQVFDGGGFRVVIDPQSAAALQGGRVDWVNVAGQYGFEVQSPQLEALRSTPLESPLGLRVKMVIDRDISPFAATHGGVIRLVDVRRNIAYVEMKGRCQGCGMASVTLQEMLERLLKQAVPEIERIVDVTDHGAGRNPYC